MYSFSEIKTLAKLAWPLLIAQVTQTLMGVSDTVMAGHASATDMAAVAVGASLMFPCMIFLQGVIMALPPIISRLHGKGETHAIINTGHQAFWLSIGLSLPFFVLSFYTPEMIALIPMEEALRHITSDYLRYVFAGFPAFVFYQVLRQYGEGLSVTKPSMLIMFIGLLVNIPANYIFINGHLGLPALGGAGCGIATTLVYCAMLIATWLYCKYAKKMADYPFFAHFHGPQWPEMKKLLKLGVPTAFTLLFEVTLFTVVAVLLARYGTKVVASHQIALSISSVFFMLPFSVGMASTIRIGYLLGRDQPDTAKSSVNNALILSVSIAAINAVFCYGFRYELSSLYSIDKAVIEMASSLMLLAALFQFSDAIQIVAGCALRGYKDAKAMFYLSFVSYWVLGLSTGLTLAMTDWIVPAMQAKGFWIGFIVGLTAAAIVLIIRLRYVQKRPLPAH
ncbi:MATE family efflux transporter [Alteromonas sp. a30]|uniref:MATE family efflux transporter n=1 Tax=Alteromonas sp. a30 TaxID=2730917 RepID=UPI00227F0582|nr:MATE family efflux transporter [Alteromonas sp. a30]MCY7296399.1 MATE family efflux transporter [Alteromonas sp. a30]